MSGKKQVHVVPSKSDGWAVRQSGASRASRLFLTKQPAVTYGRKLSQGQNGEFVIHNRNGRIAQKNSHGNDPFPPRG